MINQWDDRSMLLLDGFHHLLIHCRQEAATPGPGHRSEVFYCSRNTLIHTQRLNQSVQQLQTFDTNLQSVFSGNSTQSDYFRCQLKILVNLGCEIKVNVVDLSKVLSNNNAYANNLKSLK